MPILQTKNLQKHFQGVHAVDHISFGFAQGKITSIIGPNGSGKTTLMNTISGLYQMDGGTVIISDREYKKISPRKIAQMGITRTFQHVRLFEQMTVLDNILVVLTERGVTASLFEKHTKEHITQAKRVLKRVDLWDKRNDLANNLSYGQRKLLEIARTLAMDAKMYLFDEPFAGLFPQMRKIVISIIQELRDAHHAVVLIEHSMELIRQLSDYVYVMDAGKLLAEGTAEEVLSSKHVIEAYLGE